MLPQNWAGGTQLGATISVRWSLVIMLNSNHIPRLNKVKYLGVHFCCNTGMTDLSDICKKFYGQFNSILSVLGKCSNGMAAVHLTKTYCLPTLTVQLLSRN